MWSQGEGGGSPSEAYSIKAMLEAGAKVTHLSPWVPGLTRKEDVGNVRFLRVDNPFQYYQPLLKTNIALLYRLPAVRAWMRIVLKWLKDWGEKFDLVVGHSSETIFALRMAGDYLGVPALSRLYGISAPLSTLGKGIRKELYFDLVSLLRRPPDHIILTDDGTCGDEIARIFAVPCKRYDFLMNGYEPSILSLECPEAQPSFVLTACRLVDWKRVDRVIRIASMLRGRLPELKFVILGEGPEKVKLRRLIEHLGVGSTVTLAGSVTRPRMYELLSRATVVLSTQDLSNLNNTVLEALVMGKPVVALDTGCTGKLIRHEETGLLYSPSDLAGAASGVERLLLDEVFRKTLAERAKAKARVKLKTWPERMSQEAAVYRRFLA